MSQLERQLALLASLVIDVARQALNKFYRGQLDHAAICRLALEPVEPEVTVAVDEIGVAFQHAGAQSLELLLTDAPAMNLQLGGRSIGQPESRLVVDLKWSNLSSDPFESNARHRQNPFSEDHDHFDHVSTWPHFTPVASHALTLQDS